MATDSPGLLNDYRAKRHFDRTPEPEGRARRSSGQRYTVQKHAARSLHYDFRLELDGVLKSWAVPKGPSLDPAVKRLAVRTEDHPVDYATFEGRIPHGNYGAGTVLLWDHGTWASIGDPHEGLKGGKLAFRLHGERLAGRWALVRIAGEDRGRRNWLLVKEADEKADGREEITDRYTTSVVSGRDLEAIAEAPAAEWRAKAVGQRGHSNAGRQEKRSMATEDQVLPKFVPPALATLVDDVPGGDDWLFEVKFDGYRALAAAAGEEVRIYTRSGLDWTGRYPSIAKALAGLNLPGVLLDGEIVVIDENGRPDFAALQRAMKEGRAEMAYFAFDLLVESGRSLRTRPLLERKMRLKGLLGAAGRKGPVFYTDHIERDGAAMLDTLCDRGFEGVIAKRAHDPYRPGRGRSWLKIKCAHEQEFVIVGWSPSTSHRLFASVLLGVHENGALRYAGRVGAGFSAKRMQELMDRFRPVRGKPVSGPVPASVARSAHWVRPELVAQIAFADFTAEGLVRQGRFIGLREDKEAEAVMRETAKPADEPVGETESEAMTIGDVRLTHPDKVLFPGQGIAKRDLANYLDFVAEYMLPYVADRPLTLVRCPDGISESCFIQRHGGRGLPSAFHELPVREADGKMRRYIYLDGREGLLAAAQIGALELHIWGSRIDRVERPDRIVFDLDPDTSVDFELTKEAALRMRDVLEALELESFALVTGGKGIHVVAPIQRRHEWPLVKAFAKTVAERLAGEFPDRYVTTASKEKRRGRIFIDYLRNDQGATAIAPYSTRMHAGAPLAVPVAWRELEDFVAPNVVTIESAASRLRRIDPWKNYQHVSQRLKAAALRALGV